jgi:hypothetical protein
MFVAIISLLVVITIFLLAIKLAALAMILTGMSQESARFQAISAMAGVGFTTKESEAVISHPARRRIISILMLTGNIGIPAVVATLVVSLLSMAQAEDWWWPVLILLGGLGLLTFIGRSRYMVKYLNKWLAWALKRITHLDARDYVSLLQLQNGYAVTEMIVEPGDWLDKKSLLEAALSREGLLVLGIQFEDGTYSGAPRAVDTIHAGDTLILYGRIERLKELDQREASLGESAHQKAVKEYAAEAIVRGTP